jgi:hypothetical protein
VSTDTLTERESVLAMALRILQSLEALEEEHSDWLEALRAQELLDTAGYYGLEEDSDWLEEAAGYRETVRLYLEREAKEYGQWESVSEDRDPVWLWLESSLDVATIWESRSGEEPEPRGWEILLCYGGPSAGLELEIDGRATVWAAHWSPTERVHGRLDWLANYLEELGL